MESYHDKIKMLLFAASFPPPSVGGSVQQIFNVFSNFPPHSVVIHTANANPSEAEKIDKEFPQRVIRHFFITHVQEGLKRNIVARKLASLREYVLWPIVAFWLIIRERPDVIHIGEYNFAGVAAWIAQRFLGIPYIFHTYAEEIPILSRRRLHYKIFLTILRRADIVLTVSEYTRQLLTEVGVAPERIIKVLPSVGEKKAFAHTPEQIETIRQKYNLENHKVLLTVGLLEERKGHFSVINALNKITLSFPNIKYVVVGTGPTEEDLRQQTQEKGLIDQVVFTGRVDDDELSCLYKICDVFVMPHRQIPATLDTEGCPTVFLEASAHGKPVIGGNAGGVSDAIINEETGYIINGTDEIVLANIIVKLLNDQKLAKKMGEAGRRYVEGLTPQKNSAKVFEISMQVAKKCMSS